MANAWKEVDMIASEAVSQLQDALVITNLCARDKTAEFNAKPNGYAIGQTVRIKTRPDYVANDFNGAIVTQEIRSSTRSLTIEKLMDVSVILTAKEKALDFEGFTEEVIQPAMYRLAEKCDLYVGTKLLNAAGAYISTDLFGSAADMALARQAGNVQQLSPTGRFCLVNDTLEAKLLGKDYMNRNDIRADDGVVGFREARMGRAMNMDFYQTMQFPTSGVTLAAAGTGVTTTNNGAAVNGIYPNNKLGDMNLIIAALTNTFPAGTRIKIAGVRRPLVVASLVAATATTVPLVYPISEPIPDAAAVTVVGTGKTAITYQGVILDDQSLAVAMPLLDPASDKPSFVVSSNGFSIRVVTGYDMTAKTEVMSLDLLIGAECWDPRRLTLVGQGT